MNTGNKVCVLKMNKPELRNPITDVMSEMIDTLQAVQYDDRVKVVIITGAEQIFCVGGNLKNVQGDVHQLLHLIRNVEKPMIAAVKGAAAGAGVSLALACDLVIAARSAFFIQSFVKIGTLPEFGAIHFLTQIVGPHRCL